MFVGLSIIAFVSIGMAICALIGFIIGLTLGVQNAVTKWSSGDSKFILISLVFFYSLGSGLVAGVMSIPALAMLFMALMLIVLVAATLNNPDWIDAIIRVIENVASNM